MIMPVHHNQLLRYPCPSPATLPYFFVARIKPNFLTTKLRMSAQPHRSGTRDPPGTDEDTTADGEANTDNLEVGVGLVHQLGGVARRRCRRHSGRSTSIIKSSMSGQYGDAALSE